MARIDESCPHTTLHNMGTHLGSSNKREIPVLIKKSININYSRNRQKEKDILTAIHINIKLRRARRRRSHCYYKRWPVWL